jgi:hypothetical protein
MVELRKRSVFGLAAVYIDARWSYITPMLMSPQTATFFLIVRLRFHTTTMGSRVQTTSAKTETAGKG